MLIVAEGIGTAEAKLAGNAGMHKQALIPVLAAGEEATGILRVHKGTRFIAQPTIGPIRTAHLLLAGLSTGGLKGGGLILTIHLQATIITTPLILVMGLAHQQAAGILQQAIRRVWPMQQGRGAGLMSVVAVRATNHPTLGWGRRSRRGEGATTGRSAVITITTVMRGAVMAVAKTVITSIITLMAI